VAKLIILSIIIMTFVVPAFLAASPRPKQALKRTQAIMLVYIVIWAYMCVRWYPQLVPLK
jgi:hypothetical protein